MTEQKPYKPTKAELLLLNELAQPFTLLEGWGGMNSRIYITKCDENWKRIGEKNKVRWPSGDFSRSGYTHRLTDADYPKYGRKPHFSGWIEVITDKGRDALEQNRTRLDKIKAAKAQEQAKAERLVVVGYSRGFSGGHGGLRRFAAIVRVNRETDNRLYVTEVGTSRAVSPDGPGAYYGFTAVQGRDDPYVAREDVLVDPATMEQFKALVLLDDKRMEAATAVNQREKDELEPIRKRWQDLREQNEAMFLDEEKDILKGA